MCVLKSSISSHIVILGSHLTRVLVSLVGYPGGAILPAYDALKQRFDGGGDLPAAILVNSISTFEGFATLWRNDRRLFAGVRVGCFDWDPFAACLPIDSFMLRQDVEGLIASCFRWFDAGEERAGERVMVAPRLMVDDLEARDSSAA